MCTPQKLSRAMKNALKAEARQRMNAIDAAAEREAEAMEFIADLTEQPVPILPHVLKGLMISAALALHEAFPLKYRHPLEGHAKNVGHFQKQNAQRAAERVAAGGRGKMEIVTRQDKARRAVKAAARRLDALEAVDPLTRHAVEIVRSMLKSPT
jgi:hypothetical protein